MPLRSNVREPLVDLLGRERELARLDAALGREGRRWVTLRGPVGVGKTHLALHHAATQPLAAYAGGIWFSDLRRAGDATAVASAVARATRCRRPHSPDGLGEALRARGPIFVVLDGADRATSEVSDLLEGWLSAAPALHVVVTSTVRFGGRGEVNVAVDPLGSAEAGALFRARAAEARGCELDDSPTTGEAIDAIVRAVGGLPLAIELLAPQTVACSPAELADRAGEVLDALVADGTAPLVARTRRALGRAVRSLSPRARELLRVLAPHARELPLREIEARAGGSSPGGLAVALAELCDRSLISARAAPGHTEHAVHPLARAYVRREIARRRDAPDALARWADWALESAEQAAAEVGAPGAVATLARHREDLEAVLRHALDEGDHERRARSALVLTELALLHGARDGTWALLDEGLADLGALAPALRCRARHARARVAWRRGASATATEDFAAALVAAEQLGADAIVARIAADWANALRSLGRRDEATSLYERALGIYGSLGLPAEQGSTLAALASMTHEAGDLERAQALFEEAVALLESTARRLELATARENMGLVAQESGDLDRAEVAFREALEEHRALGHRRFEAISELDLACVDLERGHAQDALDHLTRAVALADAARDRHEMVLARAIAGACHAITGAMDAADRAFAAARADLREVDAPALRRAVDVLEAHRDLAAAYRSRLAGDPRSVARHLALVDACLARAEAARADGDELRFAIRVLRRERARHEERARCAIVAHDGTWLDAGVRGPIQLTRRPLLQRLLRALAAQHLRRPGVALPPDALLRAGWPGERALTRASRNRLHVALATLRKLGLGAHLTRTDGGYQLERIWVHA